MKPVYIVDYKRTPFGAFNGALSDLSAVDLAAHCIRPLLANTTLQPELLVMGQALPAGSGQCPTTTLLHTCSLPNLPSYSINKVCASGMRAIMSGCDAIQLSQCGVVLAGGVESMSRVPHLWREARRGKRFGKVEVEDGVEWDGLRDGVWGWKMGECGDLVAKEYSVSREDQDRLAKESFERAIKSNRRVEMVPLEGLDDDEQLTKFKPEKMASLRPAFSATGTITAANSSPMSDGAAFLLLSSDDKCGSTLAKVIGYADATVPDTRSFPLAMVPAIKKALQSASIDATMVSKWELSEAFAVVPLVVAKELGVDPLLVNQWGGAVAIGHPLGASGARLVGSLAVQLSGDAGSRYGVAAVCNGGGGASAIVLERV